ncbi:MAG: hypothetical protein HGB17_05235 [Syntrophobacteraceae bacterium]|nr:hypothetical protein [Syntrophobacteraceae bacterium]
MIGTEATVASGAYTKAIQALAPGAHVVARACPLFVALAEEGYAGKPATRLIAEEYLAPFREAVSAGVHCVMTSHSLYPAVDSQWPATLSPALCSDWLRRRLGFEGVLLSDDLDMAAVAQRFSWETVARQGTLSSIDFFLLCQNPQNIELFSSALGDLLNRSSGLRALHDQSALRIRRLFLRLGLTGAAW